MAFIPQQIFSPLRSGQLGVRQKVDGPFTSTAELSLTGQAVGISVAAFADVVGLQGDGGLDGGGLAAGLGTDVEVGVVEQGLRTGAGDVVHSGSEA